VSYRRRGAYAPSGPALSNVDPESGGDVAGGQRVTVWGSGLIGVTACTFGGLAVTEITEHSPRDFTCLTPAHAAGAVDVEVITAAGSATMQNAFTYGGATRAATRRGGRRKSS
jgi:hypothetical protein